MALYKQWQRLQKTAQQPTEAAVDIIAFGEVEVNMVHTSSEDQGSTAEVDNPDEVIVLDGAKLKSLIKDYAKECIREELINVLKML
jgi:hypothetical protein